MDRQHDVLFGLIEQVHDLIASGAETKALHEALGAFSDAALDHFVYEQKLMGKSDFHGSDRDWAKHRAVIAGIAQIAEVMETGRSPARAFGEVVTEWQRHHVGGLDRDLANHMQARRRDVRNRNPVYHK